MQALTHSITHPFTRVFKVDNNCTHSWLFRPSAQSQSLSFNGPSI